MTRFKKRYLLALLVIAGGALFPGPAAAAAAPTPFASGFDAPRGVEFFHGKLVVAEAGHGGRNCTGTPGTPGVACFGRTGKISWGTPGPGPHPALVDHLFSLAEFFGPNPDFLGLGGLSSRGGKLMAIEGIYPQAFDGYQCGDPGCQEDLEAARREAGALLALSNSGSFRVVANVGRRDFDYTANQPGQEHDANPYGVLAVNGGTYVADAGSNTLDFVSNGGRISILHHWTNHYAGFPSDEVPTCVAQANDSLWVATLRGNLYRVHGGSADLVPAPLLKHVTGCTTDQNDNVYFVNITTADFPTPFTGDIVKFNADEGSWSEIAAGLNFPNMDVVGPDGNLYFSADSVCPAPGSGNPGGFCANGGTVWKLAIASGDNDGGDRNGDNHRDRQARNN